MIGKLIVAFAPLVISNSSPGLEFTQEIETQPSNYVQLDTASPYMDSDSDFSEDHEVIIIVCNY